MNASDLVDYDNLHNINNLQLVLESDFDQEYVCYSELSQKTAFLTRKGQNLSSLMHALAVGDFEETKNQINSKIAAKETDMFGNTPLHYASMSTYGPCFIKLLLDDRLAEENGHPLNHATDINAINFQGCSPLSCALQALEIDLDIVKELLICGADVNLCNMMGNNSLHCALGNPKISLDVIKTLLAHGVNVNTKNGDGLTPLAYALQISHISLSIITELVNNDARVSIRNTDGDTALHLAVYYQSCRLHVLRELLQVCTNIDFRNGDGNTPLIAALQSHATNPDIVLELLTHGADVNFANIDGWTALHLAVLKGSSYFGIITELLERGADVNAQNKVFNTPLHIAVSSPTHNLNIVEKLLEYDADVMAMNRQNITPLLCAVKNQSQIGIIYKLLEHGALPTMPDAAGNTALHWAMRNREIDIAVISALMFSNACPLSTNYLDHDTPLHCAVRNPACNYSIVRLICLMSAHKESLLYTKNINGDTVLHLAVQCFKSSTDVIGSLLALGANPNVKNNKGNTPLHYAVQSHSDEVIRRLLLHGARVSVYNNAGATPLSMAVHGINQNLETVQKVSQAEQSESSTSKKAAGFYLLCAKLMVRCSLLNSELPVKLSLPLIGVAGSFLGEYLRACCDEILAMKCDKVYTNELLEIYSIFDIANQRLKLSKDKLTISGDFIDYILFSFHSGKYLIYKNIIGSCVERAQLLIKIQQQCIYTKLCINNSSTQTEIALNRYCVLKVAQYLSNVDIIHLALAYIYYD